MSLYDITDRAEQAKVKPAYKLMFLTKCRTHGIIPQGLRVTLPVRSTKAGTIAEGTGHALVRGRIGEVHRQKGMFATCVTQL